MILTHPLILASNSPRRQQILREAGFDFEVFTKSIDEDFDHQMDVRQVAEFLANKKNSAYREDRQEAIIITADTTVVLEDTILNKPEDEQHATEMLVALSGKEHEVISGVCVSYGDQVDCFSDTTIVQFKNLTEEEIDYYIKHFRPLDKAGAYGIQEWIGMIGVTKMEGSYFNVVGLPIHRLYQVLHQYEAN